MGVTRLFRWFHERYPYAVGSPTAVTRASIGHLYIDFNSLIHEVLRRDSYVTLQFSEATMFGEIAEYLCAVVAEVQPQERIYIAVDGVAPDAKINQQRQRRVVGDAHAQMRRHYQSQIADIAQVYDQTAAFTRETFANTTSDDKTFPAQNTGIAISPGTCFMDRLHSFMILFLTKCVEERRPGWGHCEVVFSGWDVCGEGEHKILHELRKARTKPEAARGTHCVFGMDGDIVLLTLGVHLPELYIMRRWQEPIVFPRVSLQESKLHPIAKEFIIVDVACFREFLVSEILGPNFLGSNLEQTASLVLPEETVKRCKNECQNEKERELAFQKHIIWSSFASHLIVDFIVLTLFVGNDFLPPVLGMSIKQDALDIALSIYSDEVRKEYFSSNATKSLAAPLLSRDDGFINLKCIHRVYSSLSEKQFDDVILSDIESLLRLPESLNALHAREQVATIREWCDRANAEIDELACALELTKVDRKTLVRSIEKQMAESPAFRQHVYHLYYTKFYSKFNGLYLPFIEARLTEEQKRMRPPTIKTLLEALESTSFVRNQERTSADSFIQWCLFSNGGPLYSIAIISIILLDAAANIEEANKTRDLTEEEQKQFNLVRQLQRKETFLCHFEEYHQLLRSYIRTVVMIVKYYTTDTGNPEWNWYYPFSSSPLITDLTFYTACCHLDVTKEMQSHFLGELSESNAKLDPDERKVFIDLLKSYRGPRFNFIPGAPKTALAQLFINSPPSKLEHVLPRYALRPDILRHHSRVLSWETMFILPVDSAFEAFIVPSDMTVPMPGSLRRSPDTYTSGMDERFIPYHKDYPLGLSEFFDIEAVRRLATDYAQEIEATGTPLTQQSLSHINRVGANVHILAEPRAMEKGFDETCTRLSRFYGPGQRFVLNRDRCICDYELYYSDDLTTMKEKKLAPEDFSVAVWLRRLYGEGTTKELLYASAWFDYGCNGIYDVLSPSHTSVSRCALPYPAHFFFQIEGDLHFRPENAPSCPFQETYHRYIEFGPRVYNAILGGTNMTHESQALCIVSTRPYRSQTCMISYCQDCASTSPLASNGALDEYASSLLNFCVLGQEPSSDFDEELAGFISERTGCNKDLVWNGTPLFTYGNANAGILFGVCTDDTVWLREGLCPGKIAFKDASAKIASMLKKQGNISQGGFFDRLKEAMLAYWTKAKGVRLTDPEYILIMAPLTSMRKINQFFSSLTVEESLYTDFESALQEFVHFICNRTIPASITSAQYHSIVPLELFPFMLITPSMLHAADLRYRYLVQLERHLGFYPSQESIDALTWYLTQNRTHTHVEKKTLYRITCHAKSQDSIRTVLGDLPHTLITYEELTSSLLAASQPLSMTMTRRVSLSFPEFTLPKVDPLTLGVLTTPCKDYVKVIGTALNRDITEAQLLRIIGGCDIRGSDGYIIDLGMGLNRGLYYVPGYYVVVNKRPVPTYLTVLAVLLYARALPDIFDALTQPNLQGRLISNQLFCVDNNFRADHSYNVSGRIVLSIGDKTMELSTRTTASITKLTAIPLIPPGTLLKRGKQAFRPLARNVVDHLLSAASQYIHSVIVPIVQTQYIPPQASALGQPLIGVVHEALCMWMKRVTRKACDSVDVTLHDILSYTYTPGHFAPSEILGVSSPDLYAYSAGVNSHAFGIVVSPTLAIFPTCAALTGNLMTCTPCLIQHPRHWHKAGAYVALPWISECSGLLSFFAAKETKIRTELFTNLLGSAVQYIITPLCGPQTQATWIKPITVTLGSLPPQKPVINIQMVSKDTTLEFTNTSDDKLPCKSKEASSSVRPHPGVPLNLIENRTHTLTLQWKKDIKLDQPFATLLFDGATVDFTFSKEQIPCKDFQKAGRYTLAFGGNTWNSTSVQVTIIVSSPIDAELEYYVCAHDTVLMLRSRKPPRVALPSGVSFRLV
ncbi:5'-3' exoribonuclease 2 [Giardia muris]|uniref:5'-3' exoribonuclease 2 n=1 Tax=Giardia muris TaxID=5742 RepID=A0A4Z1SWH2_GIAMU|nr:5'-3' exoribonuclease 2 [Giardia muris]|eukprot:TNJ30086.1 5'-3' exoribonuclease 2 [Giardia muris]